MHVKTISHPQTLAPVRKEFEAFLEKLGFDYLERGQIVLVVNEAMANVMRHAYHGAFDKPIELLAEDIGHAIRIEMRDWGNGHLPKHLPDHKEDPLTPGGLGLICLRQFMDDVQFKPESDGMTLIMTRKKPTRSQELIKTP